MEKADGGVALVLKSRANRYILGDIGHMAQSRFFIQRPCQAKKIWNFWSAKGGFLKKSLKAEIAYIAPSSRSTKTT